MCTGYLISLKSLKDFIIERLVSSSSGEDGKSIGKPILWQPDKLKSLILSAWEFYCQQINKSTNQQINI